MPLNTQEIMSVLSQLAEQHNLRVAVMESMKCGLGIGLAACLSALVMGPMGFAVGGTFGSIFAAYKTSGKFKSVARVIQEDMSFAQQSQLAASCMKIIQDFRVEDVAMLLPLLLNSPSAQQALLNQVVSYVTNEMKLKIID